MLRRISYHIFSSLKRVFLVAVTFMIPLCFLILQTSAASSTQEAKHIKNVLVLHFDPYISSQGKNISDYLRVGIRREEMLKQFIDSMYAASGKTVYYNVVEWYDVTDLPFPENSPREIGGEDRYLELSLDRSKVTESEDNDNLNRFQYNKYMDRYNIPNKVNNGIIDEVFILCEGWSMGTYESQMIGDTAYWCNSPPIFRDDSKNFVVMSFYIDRGIDLWMHAFGHRTECIMGHIFNCDPYGTVKQDAGSNIEYTSLNLWQKFTNRYDTKNVYKNAILGVGVVHFPVNATKDYECDNETYVDSNYKYFIDYPNSKHPISYTEKVNRSTWENAFPPPSNYILESEWSYLMWWYTHMPRGEGKTNGVSNDWWSYITNPNLTSKPNVTENGAGSGSGSGSGAGAGSTFVSEEKNNEKFVTNIEELNGSYYARYDFGNYNWDEAEEVCRSLGGHLVSITSLKEQKLVKKLLKDAPLLKYWIGATNVNQEGPWTWVTGEKMRYQNWAPNQPDNCDQMEHYAVIHTRWYVHTWDDRPNEHDYNGFICEWESAADVPSYVDPTIATLTEDALTGASSWAKEGIHSAKTRGLTTFELGQNYQDNTTRIEFCVAAVNFLEKYYEKSIDIVLQERGLKRTVFNDTANPYIGAAAALGITSGTDTEKNLFSPDSPITREQAATMLQNVIRATNMNIAPQARVLWTDAKDISSWAQAACTLMFHLKVMSGISTNVLVFSPKTPYTHEQSLVTLNNLWNYLHSVSPLLTIPQ